MQFLLIAFSLSLVTLSFTSSCLADSRPNILLVMADDQGWGETSYNGHPVLRTPNLDAMSEAGLRFNRFYAGAPVCSPTRAAVLTGRSCVRAGVPEHGYALRHQEITLPELLADAGYQTAHFGKWHLNGLRGPGVPILKEDPFHPGTFGFEHWLSVTNFYDRDPLLSRMGTFEDNLGDSSDVIVDQALQHIATQAKNEDPFFTVIWYGTPHSPFKASELDNGPFKDLDKDSMHHYGELAALDRSIGTLRSGLRDLNIENETLFWYCSDNGGLPKIKPQTTGGLRGNKGLIYEGGLRVPGIIEWPGKIQPRQTDHPASVMDMLPTLLELAGVDHSDPARPHDGISLASLFEGPKEQPRTEPICFRYKTKAAIVDGNWKLLSQKYEQGNFELYNLADDPTESKNIASQHPKRAAQLEEKLSVWYESTRNSIDGADYPEKTVNADHPTPQFWTDTPRYQPYLEQWKSRWEYASWMERRKKK